MAEVTGTSGDDVLNGSFTDDVLRGLGGNDLLDGRGGRDRLEGGVGDDTYVIDSTSDLVVELAGEGHDTIYSEVDFRLADSQHVEVVSARAWAAITNLSLAGNSLANALYGNAGDNFLNGGGGADVMTGFGGNDTYVVDHVADRVIESAGDGYDIVYTDSNFRLADNSHVELLSARDWRSTTALQLWGNALANLIDGNDGDNFIDGEGGADLLVGMDGHDVYVVDDPGDQVVEGSDGGTDVVYTSVSYTLAADTFVETLSARDVASTGALALTGNGRENLLYGTAGNDVLDGGGGRDFMYGGVGDDTYYVDRLAAEGSSFRDTIFELEGEGTDTVFLVPAGNAVYFTLDPFVENAHVLDPAYDFFVRLIGNPGDNRLSGGAAADTLRGMDGDDYLDGKGGGDGLFGGAGADTFAFTTALERGPSGIADFETGVDKIALDNAVFAGLAEGALSPDAFVNGGAAQDADDRIIFNGFTLSFDPDGTGPLAAVYFASFPLAQPAGLGAADFVVI